MKCFRFFEFHFVMQISVESHEDNKSLADTYYFFKKSFRKTDVTIAIKCFKEVSNMFDNEIFHKKHFGSSRFVSGEFLHMHLFLQVVLQYI